MLTLEGLQKTVARSVLGKTALGLSPLMAAGAADPYRRIRIYQNNTRSTLTNTLMTVFPVTVRMVDERFFRHVANEFVRLHPPSEPRLVRYGADFPAFLRTLKGLEELPFVSETARLEWAIAEALDAASLPPVPIAALSGAGAEAAPDLILQPSLRMLISHWPVLAIWSAHQDGGAPTRGWHRKPERIALWRSGDNIRFVRLSGAEFSFRYSLERGLPLEKAVARALTHDPMFDLPGAISRLFGDGLVARVRFDDFHQIEGLPS